MRRFSLLMVAPLFVVMVGARPAAAIPAFYDVFKKDYLESHPDKKYVEALTKTSDKCFVCHQGKKSKKNHNVFGKLLVGKLDRKKDARDKEKISEMIKKAIESHVDPKDEKSETYMDRIKASKWPAGDLEDIKKEPKEDEAK